MPYIERVKCLLKDSTRGNTWTLDQFRQISNQCIKELSKESYEKDGLALTNDIKSIMHQIHWQKQINIGLVNDLLNNFQIRFESYCDIKFENQPDLHQVCLFFLDQNRFVQFDFNNYLAQKMA